MYKGLLEKHPIGLIEFGSGDAYLYLQQTKTSHFNESADPL